MNVAAWSMYIEMMYETKRNSEECSGCYLQLLNSAAVMEEKECFWEVLHEFWSFAKRNQLPIL